MQCTSWGGILQVNDILFLLGSEGPSAIPPSSVYYVVYFCGQMVRFYLKCNSPVTPGTSELKSLFTLSLPNGSTGTVVSNLVHSMLDLNNPNHANIIDHTLKFIAAVDPQYFHTASVFPTLTF